MTALDRVRARVQESGGPELVERLDHLDGLSQARRTIEASPPPPDKSTRIDYDVVIAGGGLWSILAPLLESRGLTVAVVERARTGVAHREWNASGPELRVLVDTGLVSESELQGLITARYDHGVCRFHRGRSHPVRDVLDHAVDAGPLLAHARRAGEARGVTFMDGCTVVSHGAGTRSVRVRCRDRAGATEEITARLLVDARGAASPYLAADLMCPTVGGVVTGLTPGTESGQSNPRIGDILATIDPIDGGRQYVWEAFPGRPGETTVYLFFYARAGEDVSLWDLYARFFTDLPRYKAGDATLLRPTFGLIPGWSRLTPPREPESSRVVLVGDAAARHSPLTYCGFGATLRSLARARDSIVRLVDGAIAAGPTVHDAPVHALTGILAHMMASRRFEGDELNTLLDAAFESLHEMGNDSYAGLLRDEMAPATFVSFLRRTAARHPAVWAKVSRGLGVGRVGRWGLGIARAAFA